MVHIEITHTFRVPVSEAFAYITDMRNWPEYFPNFVRLQDPANARWAEAGDKVTLILKLLTRERAVKMELVECQTDSLVTYRSRQQGLPEARHERHFKAVPEGLEFRVVVAYEPRKGIAGLFDRFLVKRGVERALRRTMENLEHCFERHGLRA